MTLVLGLRWEYFSPYVEKYNRLTNLAHNADFTQISTVCATAATGCTVGSPRSLVNPDKVMYSPRLGVAWSPKFKFTRNTVVRAGYGINYNTGAVCGLRAGSGVPAAVRGDADEYADHGGESDELPAGPDDADHRPSAAPTQATQSNYAVNPNYRLGFVQVFSVNLQRSLPRGVVLNIGYNGAVSGDLDMLRAPNRTASGVC